MTDTSKIDDTTMIDDDVASIELTKTVKFGVGRHRCDKCRAWTPRPDAEVIRRFAIEKAGQSYIWPFSDWWPRGWMKLTEDCDKNGYPKGQRTLCAGCAAIVLEALKGLP